MKTHGSFPFNLPIPLRLEWIGAALALLGCTAHGGSEIDPAEHEPVDPITIEGTMPSPARELSLGLTMDYQRSEGGAVAHLPSVSVSLGLTDFLDVDLEVPFLYSARERKAFGIGDVSTTFKLLLAAERELLPVLVLGIEAVFPTGSVRRGFGEGNYELRPFLAALKTFGSVVVQGNIGWSRVIASRSGEHGELFLGGLSIAAPLIARKLYVFAELSGSKVVNRRESLVTVAPGLKWLLSDEIFFAVGVPIPVRGESSGFGIVSQCEWTF